jgi:hypothetical protein
MQIRALRRSLEEMQRACQRGPTRHGSCSSLLTAEKSKACCPCDRSRRVGVPMRRGASTEAMKARVATHVYAHFLQADRGSARRRGRARTSPICRTPRIEASPGKASSRFRRTRLCVSRDGGTCKTYSPCKKCPWETLALAERFFFTRRPKRRRNGSATRLAPAASPAALAHGIDRAVTASGTAKRCRNNTYHLVVRTDMNGEFERRAPRGACAHAAAQCVLSGGGVASVCAAVRVPEVGTAPPSSSQRWISRRGSLCRSRCLRRSSDTPSISAPIDKSPTVQFIRRFRFGYRCAPASTHRSCRARATFSLTTASTSTVTRQKNRFATRM